MATTTWATMRAHYCGSQTQRGVLEALTPATSPERPFCRSRANKPLREWADGTTSAAFRQFEWSRTGDAVEPNVFLPDVILREEQATLTVAYPDMPMLYGGDVASMEDLIREDARKLRDALLSPGNLPAGVLAVMPSILAPERGDDIWFQEIVCELIYYEAQTLA